MMKVSSDALRLREMFSQAHQTLLRHLKVVPDGSFTEFERGALRLTEAWVPPIRQNISEFLNRNTRSHADGVADIHSKGYAIERGHLHVE